MEAVAPPPAPILPPVDERRIFRPRTGMAEYVPVCGLDCIGRPIEIKDCTATIRLFPQDQVAVKEQRGDGRTLLCRHPRAKGLLILDINDTEVAKL